MQVQRAAPITSSPIVLVLGLCLSEGTEDDDDDEDEHDSEGDEWTMLDFQ
jgi:hypothetical protein